MNKHGGGEPSGDLATAINFGFGSFDALKDKLKAAAPERFGSGWAWLIVKDGNLGTGSTPNEDTPHVFGAKALLGIDVWEHAPISNIRIFELNISMLGGTW